MEVSMEVTITKDNFKTEVLESEIPVLLDFWAPWCGPCRMLGPVVSAVATKYEGRVKVGKVNCDEEQELADEYGVMSIPMLLVFKNGEVVNKSVGYASQDAVEALLN